MPQFPIPNILSVLTFLPLVGAILLMFCKRPQDLPDHHGDHSDHHADPAAEPAAPKDPARATVNTLSLLFAVANFVLGVWLFLSYNPNFAAAGAGVGKHMQYIEDIKWISIGSVSIHYRMGIDGISMLLILLTTFLMPLCVLYSFRTKQRLKEFMIFLLILETAMIGVFCALDLVLFYIFWEALLIPMYFLIGIFGHENRIYAAVKFFIYTFTGSIFMLIAIVAIYNFTGSFDLVALTDPASKAFTALHGLDARTLMFLFAAFALAFMIKVPMFPFHTWLPDAHVEAPTAGSVILAGVMLKMGTYGLVRFCLPLFPDQAQQSAPLFIILSVTGIIYASIVATVQPDAKKLVAYSSVAHLGFVVLGIFSFTQVGMMGALLQNINHGISTPMLFFLVGMLYERRHTREIAEFGGLKLVVPFMATMFLLATLSSIAVPLFNSFVGEFTILMGSFISQTAGFGATALAATGMILSAVYMLWWFQRIMLGPLTKPANSHLPDLSKTEWAVLCPLVVLIFWIGIGSPYWTRHMDTAVANLIPPSRELINEDLPAGAKLMAARFGRTLPFKTQGHSAEHSEEPGAHNPQGEGEKKAEPEPKTADPNTPVQSPTTETTPPTGGAGAQPGDTGAAPSGETTSPEKPSANPAPKTGEGAAPATGEKGTPPAEAKKTEKPTTGEGDKTNAPTPKPEDKTKPAEKGENGAKSPRTQRPRDTAHNNVAPRRPEVSAAW